MKLRLDEIEHCFKRLLEENLGRVTTGKFVRQQEVAMKSCKLYSLSTCAHCKACKNLLSECGVEYEFTDVDLLPDEERSRVVDEITELSSRCAFPTIVIGEKVIVGFKQDEIRTALGIS
jgi:glutaredoxin-like protein NrdH